MPPPPKKKPGAARHAARFANRTGDRLRALVQDARAGTYDAQRFAQDIASSLTDALDLWVGVLGYGASPQVGVVDYGAQPQATWKGGVTSVVTLAEAVPDNPVFPTGGLRLARVDGSLTVDLQLTDAEVVADSDGFQLTVSFRDMTPAGGTLPPGDYFGNLFYTTSTDPTKRFAALVRGTVT
jgi:hypothetical protein